MNILDCMIYAHLDPPISSDDAEGTKRQREMEMIMGAASAYIGGACADGVPESTKCAEFFDAAVYQLSTHWYDHRDLLGTDVGIPHACQQLINRLKMEPGVDG